MELAVHRICHCGHPRTTHEHYRKGTDCAGCPCQSYAGRLGMRVAASAELVARDDLRALRLARESTKGAPGGAGDAPFRRTS